MSRILLTGGGHSTNKVVALVFRRAEDIPFLVTKTARVAESVPALLREAASLREIHALHPNDLPGVPKIVFVREGDGEATVGETVLTGVPLYARLRPETHRPLALGATDWLVRLAGQPQAAPAQRRDHLVEPVVDQFKMLYRPVLDRTMVELAVRALDELGPLPLAPEQRDFSPWNILVSPSGDLGVLDWESAEPRGMPAADLLYFLTYCAFFLRGAMRTGHFEDAYGDTLLPSTTLGSVTQECLDRYVNVLGMDPRTLDSIRLWTWMLHACSEYGRLVSGVRSHTTSPALRRGVFFRLWEFDARRMQVDR